MDRTNAPGATPEGLFTAGNPFVLPKVPATVLSADWHNGVQEELVGLIEAAGLTPSATDWTQVRQAIDILTANDGGSRAVVSAGLSGVPASPVFRREMQSPICLFAHGFQKNPSPSIIAGATSGPPVTSPKNTVEDNGYDGSGTDNTQPGHAWPYQTLGGQMQGDGTVDNGWFPACFDGTGINGYYYPDFLTVPGMLGSGGGKVVIDFYGILDVDAASGDHALELVLMRDPVGAWNSGNGGAANAGAFTNLKTLSLVSPYIDAATFGSGKNMHIRLELAAFFKRTVAVKAHFFVGNDGSTGDSAYMDEHRTVAKTFGASINLVSDITAWKLFWKVDAVDGLGEFPARIICNTPFGGGGSTPPLAPQDGSAIDFALSFATGFYYPPGV